MIITKTPFRVSFVGGGSDIATFYRENVGAVLSTTINRYMYISSHSFFDVDKIRLKYSKTETVNDVESVQHPIVKEVLRKFNITKNIEISSNADVPAKSGLGSSSSFTVGLLQNIYTAFGKFAGKKKLAEEACEIEIDRLKEPIGKQDQYAAAFGGLNVIKFNPDETVNVEPIHLKSEVNQTLQNNLLMFSVGNQRKASDILREQTDNLKSVDKASIMKKMVELVWDCREALHAGDLNGFGDLLHQNWLLKKQMASNISNPIIDEAYQTGIDAGALGGKLLGAGAGGFILFYCDEKHHESLRKSLSSLREMRFRFENDGTKIVYVDEDNYNPSF